MRRLLAACACAVVAVACTSTSPAVKPSGPPTAARPSGVDALRPAAGRLPALAKPTAYALALRVDPREERFSGTAELSLDVATATPVLHFHAENLNLRSATVEWNGARIPATVTALPGGDHEHAATLPSPVGPGALKLTFEYDAPFDAHLAGLYRMNEGADWYASTQLEPIDARKMFPSLDEPGWKVPFRITLTVPEGMGAFSNAPEASRSAKDGWTTVSFQPTKPIATYLVAVAVGPYDVVEGPTVHGVPIRGIAPRGRGVLLHESLELHAQLVPILEEYFGHPYPYEKLDALATIEFAAGAMENPGLVIYREEALLFDPRTSSARDREGIARVIAHELAHQWFGNLVTLAWWDDLWLNEAFAEWMANKALVQLGIERRDETLGIRQWMLQQDALIGAQPIRQPGSGVALGPQFNVATFKGAMILTMLEEWLGEAPFRQGVREYIRDRAWGHAVSDDLFAALDRHAGDKPVRAVAASFLDREGAPLIAAVLDCDGPPTVRLSQTRFHALGSAASAELPGGKPWQLPVCVAYPTSAQVATRCTLMTDRTASLPLDGAASCPAWLHPNAGEHGYYRWALAPEQVAALTDAMLRPPSGAKALQDARPALLDQLWAMVEGGALPASAYLGVLEKIAASEEPALLQELTPAVVRLVRVWQPLSVTPPFRAWVERVLGARAKALGWEPRKGDSDETRRLRGQLLGVLGSVARTPWIVNGAQERARRYLETPAAVSPELAPVALVIAARNGRLTFAELSAFLEQSREPNARLNALTALGSLPAGPELDAALKLLLTEKVRLQDAATLVGPAMNRPDGRDALMAFIESNWPALEKRLAGFSGAGPSSLQRIVGEYCEQVPRDRARTFFADKKLRAESLARNVDESSRCIAVSKVGCDGVARHLDRTGDLSGVCRAAPPGDYPAPQDPADPR